MRANAEAEIIATYSRLRCAGWALLVVAGAGFILSKPRPTAPELLTDGYGWLWPIFAVASFLVIPLAIWLAAYAVLFGGAAISRKGDRFVIYRPWPKAVPINSIKYIEASQDAQEIASPLWDASLIPRRYKVLVTSRVRIFLKNGECVAIATGLMQPKCAAIAAEMTAVLGRELRSQTTCLPQGRGS